MDRWETGWGEWTDGDSDGQRRMAGEEIRKEGGERVSVEPKLGRKLQFLGPLRKEG